MTKLCQYEPYANTLSATRNSISENKSKQTRNKQSVKNSSFKQRKSYDEVPEQKESTSKSHDEKFRKVSKSGKTFQSSIIETISPFTHGLIIASMLESSLLLQARSALTRLVLSGSKKLHIPILKPKSVLSLYAGKTRQLEQAKAFDLACVPLKNSAEHKYESCGLSDRFNWCSDEGFHTLSPIIIQNTGGWVILELNLSDAPLPSIVHGLTHIREIANQHEVWVMLFLVCSNATEKSHLIDLADEYMEVSPCEPDVDGETAFSVDCVSIRKLNSLGIGKTMCNVKLSNGKFYRSFKPFVSNKLEDRVIWNLRCEGKTQGDIANILKISESTISRRLSLLPKPSQVNMREGWLERYLELITDDASER